MHSLRPTLAAGSGEWAGNGRPNRPVRPSDVKVSRLKAVGDMARPLGELVRCGCHTSTRPGIVLDPFLGSGTVGVVAERLGRDWIGIELNPSYARLAMERMC